MEKEKKIVDDSPTWWHENEMLNTPKGAKASQLHAFKEYMKLGHSKENSLIMAGIKKPK